MEAPSEQNAKDLQAYYTGMKEARGKLVVPLVLLTLGVYFLQQFLTNFTSALDGFITENLTLAFAYSFAMFFFIIALTLYYASRITKIEDAQTPSNLPEIQERYKNLVKEQA